MEGNVQELWWDSASGWHQNNLTTAAGTPKTSANPTGYVFDAQGTQHVNYAGVDSHLYELWWNTAGWHYNDLTAATCVPPTLYADPTGYAFNAYGSQHVIYAADNADVMELFWTP